MPLTSYTFNINWLSTYHVPDTKQDAEDKEKTLELSLGRNTGFFAVLAIMEVEEETFGLFRER